jgi:hypothetical protein
VDVAPRLSSVIQQPIKVEAVILIGEETGLVIITTLNQVQRDIGQGPGWAAKHG